MNRTQSLLSMLIGVVLWLVVAPTEIVSRKTRRPTSSSSLPITSLERSGPYTGGELRGAPTPRMTRWHAKDCGLRSFWSSLHVRRRARR